ncbi:hypothetical protein COL26b_012722 [Colletotrichum chrysophilum]|uniref:uncharacterized protein n=1 Tax=Colletotrichum chrysophilum TaxID=1836956 RepID=UPI0022FFE17D|nr:uncharacterized protein COL26b_012722 [Colletotrichum chrysophilum]KAJ0340031.1 hypothetical protein KNSL1_011740 [Colletotrichum chrysophilum]KAJ0363905.1 hypothetical protein COL26b_012722 [Colletotrichum chrysophilum]
MTYIFFENQEFLANGSNVARISWSDIEGAFQHPDQADLATFGGLDWTKPYPGSSVDGFEAHLRIANDVPWPDSVGKNLTTKVTALTFGLPAVLMDPGKTLPLPMDPTWFICRHYLLALDRILRNKSIMLVASCLRSVAPIWRQVLRETGSRRTQTFLARH